MEEQSAATNEVASNIDGVSQASSETGNSATEVLNAASELSQQAADLTSKIDSFLKYEVRPQGRTNQSKPRDAVIGHRTPWLCLPLASKKNTKPSARGEARDERLDWQTVAPG